MADRTGAGWQILGTILCGFVFSLPFVIGFYIYKFIVGQVEKRKEKQAKKQTVA